MRSAVKMLGVLVLTGLAFFAVVQWRAADREAAAAKHYPPSGQIVDVNGTAIHIKVEGQGPDIVLIHGANGSLRDFTFDLVGRLSENWRVISVDRPGLGHSDRPAGYGGPFSLKAEPPALQARLLRAATDAVGVRNPVVVGHSYGGAIALAWALEHPQDTAALVLLGAASNPWPGQLDLLYRILDNKAGNALVAPMITALTPAHYIRSATGSIFAPQDPDPDYLDHFGPEMALRRSTIRANAQQVNSLRPHLVRMKDRYPALDLPVEILHGSEDVTVPIDIHAVPLSQQIPGAVLTELAGVGHMPHHSDPEAVVAAIGRAATRAGLR